MINKQEFERAKYNHAQHYLLRLKTYNRLYEDGVQNQAKRAVDQFESDLRQIEHSSDWAAHNGTERGAELSLAFCDAGGLLLSDLQDFSRRLDWYVLALQAARKLGQPNRVARQLFRLGTLHRDLNKYEAAQDYIEQALALARDHEMQDLVVDSCRELGTIAKRLGQQNAAWVLAQQALAAARVLGNDLKIADCLRTLSTIAYEMGDVEKAVDFARESHTIFEAIGSLRDVAHLAYIIGSYLLSDDEQLDDARRFLWQSYDVFTQLGVKRLAASAACNIASDLVKNLGDYEQAIQLTEDALATYRALNYPLGICNALTILGDAALHQEDLQGAHERYAEGLALAYDTKSAWDIINLLLGLGMVANQTRQFEEAQQHLSSALKIAVDGHMVGLTLLSLIQLALPLAYHAGEVERAIELIGLTLCHPATSSDVFKEARLTLARLQQELPPDVVDQALERGKQLEFDRVVDEFIQDVT